MNEWQFQELLLSGNLEIVDYFVSDDKWISFPEKMMIWESWVNQREKYLFVCQRIGNIAFTHVFIYAYSKKSRSDIHESKETIKSLAFGFLNRGH